MNVEESDERVRLFIAIELPEHVLDELEALCNAIVKKKFFLGRCTKRENLHLTLKFLGEVSPDLIPEIDEALMNVSFQSLKAHLGALDVLPTRQNIRILFVHLVCPQLPLLAQQIEDVLAERFEREPRSFKSHVTVGRVKGIDDKLAFLRELDETVVPLVQWTIDSFVLRRSVLTPEGPIYSELKRYSLS